MKLFYVFFSFLLGLFFLSVISHAQNQYAFRVSFTDKTGTTADISVPETFLSARSLIRRATQDIGIDSSDLPVSQPYIDTTLELSTGILHTRSRWQNNCVILVNDTSKINLVRNKSFVKKVTYVASFLSPLHLFKAPPEEDKPATEVSKELQRITGGAGYYGDAYEQIKLANGDFLHDKGFRGSGKMIAVLDEGFNLVNTLPGFDSLRTSGRIADVYNFNLDKSDVYGYSSHGTQVLSTMAGILKGTYAGTAPDASYALYITENSAGEQPFEMDNLVAAMERADSVGVDIITISLGYNTFSIGGLNVDLSLSDIDGKSTIAAMGANTATRKGLLVIASAGNEGATSWAKILTPGDADSALTCGSVTIDRIRSVTSGQGPNASGVLKPDVCMLGAPGVVFNNSGTTSAVNGTSIATPELAGLAACLWQAYPMATPYQLRKAIRESAHKAGSPDNALGYGVPDFGKATLSLADAACLCAENELSVFPNPFKDNISVSINGSVAKGVLSWSLYNMMGQKILYSAEAYTASAFSFDISVPGNLPSGTYLLYLQSEQYKKVVKLQK